MFHRLFGPSKDNAATQSDDPVYAIGDIHGCANLLDALLEKIEEDAAGETHTLIFLGDYVDRGPDSRMVIDRLIDLRSERPDAVFLKGNHEALMLDFLKKPEETAHWLEWGGDETLASYGLTGIMGKPARELAADLSAALPPAHLDFLQSLTLLHRDGDYVFVHAGVKPGVALDDQSEADLLWIRKAFHQCPAKQRPKEVIVHGHSPVKKPLDAGWRIAVDTSAFWTGQLTAAAIRKDRREFIST